MEKFDCVLLVDDDPINNMWAKKIITSLNITHHIEVFTNGQKALEFINQYSKENDNLCPDLMFVDIKMPVMDGFEFLAEFNKLECTNKTQVKVIVVSTSEDKKDIQKMRELGVKDYICKPLKPNTVLNQIYI